MKMLLEAQGFQSQLDQYGLVRDLGTGAFSKVMLAQHKCT